MDVLKDIFPIVFAFSLFILLFYFMCKALDYEPVPVETQVEKWDEEISDVEFGDKSINYFVKYDNNIWYLTSVPRSISEVSKDASVTKPVLLVTKTTLIYKDGIEKEVFNYIFKLPLD